MFFLLLSLYVCFSACSCCMNFFPREIFHVWIFFRPLSLLFQWSISSNLMVHGRCIECFHSRGQNLCKFIGTKESVYIRKEFNSQRIGLGHQHGRRFIVLGHQYGRHDVMWTLLPAEQGSWVLSELDKKKGELTRGISTPGRMFCDVHRVSRALISLCPLPLETPTKQAIWEHDKFYRTIIIREFIYLLRNYIVFYLCRRSYLIWVPAFFAQVPSWE